VSVTAAGVSAKKSAGETRKLAWSLRRSPMRQV
jgi:hypothetical protein